MAGLRGKVAANMAQKGMEPGMADRAGRALFRGDSDRMGRAMANAADRAGGMGGMRGGMRMQPPTPVNRPVPDELVYKKGGSVKMRNTGRMNRLEELGRVDAEKARTPRGKANLAAEKKRVVGEMKKGYKSGGMTSSYRKAADGIASKGKTKGKMVKMRMGGSC